MSEQTGATTTTTPIRDDLVMGAFEECSGQYIGAPLEEIAKLSAYTESVVDYLLFVLGRRGRVVPADAVVVTPEIAAVAAEACTGMSAVEDGQASSLWGTADDISAKCRMRANNYRAAAAALRGEG